jgi:hypothetical protein
MDKTIRIGWMYPDCLNLHGERGSVQALERVGKAMGLEVTVRRIEDFDDPIPFDDLDLLFFAPGEISCFTFIRPALERQRKALEAYLDDGGWLIAVGTTGLLFGKTTVREDGSSFEGLGLLDMTAKERAFVWGDDLHLRLRDTKMEIFGSQIQMTDVEAAEPLADVLYGRGNNAGAAEGARRGNLIFTNCLGPVFVKNPWWAEDILRSIFLRKQGLGDARPFSMESASFDSCLRFTASKPEFPIK